MYGKRRIYRRNRKTYIAVLPLLFLSLTLSAQTEDRDDSITASIESLDGMESWLLYERGLYLFDEREYGAALNHFNKLVERHGVYPEAEYWIGRVFEQEGEHILAEKQYLKALEAVRVLHIPGEKYPILYRLAELYKNRGDYDSYSQILNSIVLDELEENQLALANESPAINTLKRDGIDRMLLLFRHSFTYSIEAFNQLGIYYYKKGDYKAATSKLIYPVLSLFSVSIDYLRSLDPAYFFPEDFAMLLDGNSTYVFDTLELIIQQKNSDFSFERNTETLEIPEIEKQLAEAEAYLDEVPESYVSGTSCCLNTFSGEPLLKDLIAEYDIYRTLFYLAASLYAEGYSEASREIWGIVSRDNDAGMWQLRSQQQLINPEVETGQTIY